ncbi:MAG: hypothetical protein NC113_01620 [Bacteroides sp.]|nr:hypothetical protein [Bacteroides sp.]MCM1446920.1 hypothetical protein [Bacteroides sp.]MCM1515362.1 hypothetical protein [Paraprevotella sp.]
MKHEIALESILDLNSTNVWKLYEYDIKKAWDNEKSECSFASSEDKLLNIIRLCFDVVHYNPADPREQAKYENSEWATFQHCDEKKGWVAIRRKYITHLSDLSYENIRFITAATLLELIDRNFGGGWDSISLSMKDIILSGFDISTTTLPANRMHVAGGTLERKMAQGYEVLEITKGTWIEAIFAKKKEPLVKVRMNDNKYDEEGNLRKASAKNADDDEEELPEETEQNDDEVDNSPDDDQMDEMYYSSISEGVKNREDQGDEEFVGLSIDEGEE